MLRVEQEQTLAKCIGLKTTTADEEDMGDSANMSRSTAPAMSASRLPGQPCDTSCSPRRYHHTRQQRECSSISSLSSSSSPSSSPSRGMKQSTTTSKVNRTTKCLHRPAALPTMTNNAVFYTVLVIILLIIGFHPSDAKQGMC